MLVAPVGRGRAGTNGLPGKRHARRLGAASLPLLGRRFNPAARPGRKALRSLRRCCFRSRHKELRSSSVLAGRPNLLEEACAALRLFVLKYRMFACSRAHRLFTNLPTKREHILTRAHLHSRKVCRGFWFSCSPGFRGHPSFGAGTFLSREPPTPQKPY